MLTVSVVHYFAWNLKFVSNILSSIASKNNFAYTLPKATSNFNFFDNFCNTKGFNQKKVQCTHEPPVLRLRRHKSKVKNPAN